MCPPDPIEVIVSQIAITPVSSISASAVVQGTQGPQGPQGPQGNAGPTGATGTLPSNYVISVNGQTGVVGLPMATTGASGIASFNQDHFTVNQAARVSLNSSAYVRSFNTQTGIVNFGIPPASYSVSGSAMFDADDFSVNQYGMVRVTGNYVRTSGASGLITASGGLTSSHLYVTNGATFAGGIAGTLNTAAQTNITSLGTLSSLASSGLITASGGLTSSHLYVTNGATFAGGIVGTLNTASQPNVRLLSYLNVTQSFSVDADAGFTSSARTPCNLLGNITLNNNPTRSTTVGGPASFAQGINVTLGSQAGSAIKVTGGINIFSGGLSVTGGIAGTLNTAAQTNITSVGTLSSLGVSGLITASGGLTTNHLHVTNGATFNAGINVTGGGTVYGLVNFANNLFLGGPTAPPDMNMTATGLTGQMMYGYRTIPSTGWYFYICVSTDKWVGFRSVLS